MKQVNAFFMGVCLLLAAMACEDELPQSAQIEKGKENLTFSVGAGSRTVKIETSHPWTAVSSQSWLTVSPGKGGAGSSELTLSAAANTTNSARTATVTIQVGHKTNTIQVSQAQKDELGLDKTSETVAWTEGNCMLTVSANVDDYVVESDVSWLRETETRTMTDRSILFSYDENPDYEPRTATVSIHKDGLSADFIVTQGGRGALYFVLERAEVPATDTQYALKLMKNTDLNGFEQIDEADWVSLEGDETRAMPEEETVMLYLLPNTEPTPREVRFVINDQSTGTLLTDTFTLTQLAIAQLIRPENTEYAVTAAGETVTVPVEASGSFDVVIPAEAAAWLTGSSGVQLPGSLQFTVGENTLSEVRSAVVLLRLQDGSGVEVSITITQAAADVPATDRIPKLYNLLNMSTVIETVPIDLGAFQATVSYDEGYGWVTDINTNNSGKLHFVVGDNSGVSATKRSATLHIVPKQGEPIKIRVNQSGSNEAYIELDKPGTLASFIDLSHIEESYKKIRLHAASGMNADDWNTLRNVKLGVERADLREVKNLTVLPAGAFKECHTLREVLLPTSVTSIGAEAFADCTALEGVPFSTHLQKIGDRAFTGAFTGGTFSALDLSGATALVEISDGAFEGCNTLISLVLPAKLSKIGNGTFKECYSLEGSLTLPVTLSAIGSEAFYNCNNLAGTLSLPAALTSLGARAFMKCASLEVLDMGTSRLSVIEEETFKECRSLFAGSVSRSLFIPSGVVRIARSAFEKTLMTEVDLPATLSEMGRRAFYNCSDLVVVTCRRTGTPPALDANNPEETFGGVTNPDGRTLKVSTADVDAYKDDPSWGKATQPVGTSTWTIEPIAPIIP